MSYHNRKRLHKRVMEVGKVANPKLKSISAAALDEIQTQQDALLVNLVSRYAKNRTQAKPHMAVRLATRCLHSLVLWKSF